MTDDNVRDLPVGDVDFDLDTVEKDAVDQRPVFRTKLKGRAIEMTSPDDVDWQDLMDIGQPVELLSYVIDRDDLRFIREQRIPGWKLNKLMEAYSIHYGLDERMKRANREARLAGYGR
jgi:hypothetical protein